jgi:hypothetical protein
MDHYLLLPTLLHGSAGVWDELLPFGIVAAGMLVLILMGRGKRKKP